MIHYTYNIVESSNYVNMYVPLTNFNMEMSVVAVNPSRLTNRTSSNANQLMLNYFQ